MTVHFEELWELCEIFHKENAIINPQIILEELSLKINLYKIIDSKTEVPEVERQKMKSYVLGEILLTLSGLSFLDNINVYEALNIILQYRSADRQARKLF